MRRTALTIAVDKALRAAGRPRAGETVVVGLSGGADSVALLDALQALAPARGFTVVAAHLDHGLRAVSAADAAFCAELCARLGVDLETARADVKARARRDKGGTEEAARAERYAFLRAVLRRRGAALIAVAHTQDDQAETFLLRLVRGAGSAGLGAMRPVAGDVIRPMLQSTRGDVLAHLRAGNREWREDETNADLSFLRNRTRHELLPYLEQRFNPKVRQALARTASVLAEEADVLAGEGEALLGRGRSEDGAILIDRAALFSAPRAVARAAIRSALERTGGLRGVALAHVDRVLGLAAAARPSGKRIPLPGGRVAVAEFSRLRIGPPRAPARAFAIEVPVPGRVDLPGRGLALLAQAASGPAASNGVAAVVAAPEGPLVVRTRRPGDRVRAKGRDMSLKKFLMERRVPADERAGLPLLAAGSRVLWVPGQELGQDPGAGRYVRVRLEKRP